MSGAAWLPPPEAVERALAVAERELTRAELQAYLDAPMSERERESILENWRWFTRRYPTPAERFAYVRRAVRRAREFRAAIAARNGG